ncbi:MAG: hypothetical protein AAF500_06500 [Myxococcota bacterium]
MKLSLIAVLTGTLALVGCGDDSSGTGNEGGGGAGGEGGSGGAVEPCVQTCGTDNEFPSGSEIGSANFECAVMGIPVPLTLNLTALTGEFVPDGDTDFDVAVQTVIPASVVDLIINLATDADITDTQGVVAVTPGTPASINVGLSPVPCLVCFESGVEVIVNLDPVNGETIAVEGDEVAFALNEVTVTIDAAGLELVLSNVGDDPACGFGLTCTGGDTPGGPCTSDEDCGGGTCEGACVGGMNEGTPCTAEDVAETCGEGGSCQGPPPGLVVAGGGAGGMGGMGGMGGGAGGAGGMGGTPPIQ